MNQPPPSRKFIDLIFQASSKWANWNPPYQINVGDYGTIDEKTGDFEREGNIYTTTSIFKDDKVVSLIKDHPPQPAPREDVYSVTSAKVKRSDLKLGANVEIPGLAHASVKGQWSFGSERGALLIMAQPRTSYLPRDSLLKHLAEVEALKDMFLVTEVFHCPAYSLYLSSGDNEVVDLALVGSVPVPNAPGVTVGGEIGGGWWSQNTTGLFRSAHDPQGKDDYTPLYMLKEVRKKRGWFGSRGEIPEHDGDDLWVDAQVPWDPLDEDGKEEFEDTVFE